MVNSLKNINILSSDFESNPAELGEAFGWTEAVAESPKSELVESGRWGQNPTGPKPGPSSKSLKVCKYLIYIGFSAEMREVFHECFTKDGWTDVTAEPAGDGRCGWRGVSILYGGQKGRLVFGGGRPARIV